MAKCKECEFKAMRIGLLKEQLRLEQESANRWRKDYIMLFKSMHDLVDDDERYHALATPEQGEDSGV